MDADVEMRDHCHAMCFHGHTTSRADGRSIGCCFARRPNLSSDMEQNGNPLSVYLDRLLADSVDFSNDMKIKRGGRK